MVDIDQSHYNTGTATVSGTAVTGTGTAWIGAVRKGDLYGTHKGSGVRIASVNSNTSITLAYSVAALNQANGPYEIQRTPFDVGYLKAIDDLIQMFGSSGNLAAEAAIDGTGGNWLSYFTGAGTKARTAFTAFARSLMGAADASAARLTLGAVSLTTGETITGRKIFAAGAAGNNPIGTAGFGRGEIEVQGNGTGPAALMLIRPAIFGALLGIDNDNQLKFGGGSLASSRKVILGGKNRFHGSFVAVAGGNDAAITFVESVGFTGDSAGAGGGTRLFVPETGVYMLDYGALNTTSPSTPLIMAHTLNGSVGAARGYVAAGLTALNAPGVRLLSLTAGDVLTLRCVAGLSHSDASFNRITIMQVE